MEQLSVITLMKFKNTIERILHVKGNYQGGILEMTLVVDGNLEVATRKELIPKLIGALKQQGEVFRNVRFNYSLWNSDTEITNKVCPMMLAMTEAFYQEEEKNTNEKGMEKLVDYLKKFHARSKIIILVTDGKYTIEDEVAIKTSMQPFLDKKLVVVTAKGEDISISYRELGQ
jgi:hypothetical protein